MQAKIGMALIQGALRDEDLVPRLLEILQERAPSKANSLRERFSEVIPELGKRSDSDFTQHRDWLLADLFYALNETAPKGFHFGPLVANTDYDYGFWPISQPRKTGFSDWSAFDLMRFADHAIEVTEQLGIDPKDPGTAALGYISSDPPPREAIELGRRLAEEFGW